jgi:hypothetical protein
MEKLQELVGFFAGVLALLAFIPYINSILKGITKPSRTSWSIWFVVGLVLMVSYKSGGATNTIWMPISYVIGPFIVMILSLKYGVGGYSKLDIACICLAVISLIIWLLSQSNSITLFMYLVIDFFAVLPTLHKTYKRPQDEDRLTWIIIFTASVFNLFALDSYGFIKIAYPLYMFIGNGLILIFVLRKPRKMNR